MTKLLFLKTIWKMIWNKINKLFKEGQLKQVEIVNKNMGSLILEVIGILNNIHLEDSLPKDLNPREIKYPDWNFRFSKSKMIKTAKACHALKKTNISKVRGKAYIIRNQKTKSGSTKITITVKFLMKILVFLKKKICHHSTDHHSKISKSITLIQIFSTQFKKKSSIHQDNITWRISYLKGRWINKLNWKT